MSCLRSNITQLMYRDMLYKINSFLLIHPSKQNKNIGFRIKQNKPIIKI